MPRWKLWERRVINDLDMCVFLSGLYCVNWNFRLWLYINEMDLCLSNANLAPETLCLNFVGGWELFVSWMICCQFFPLFYVKFWHLCCLCLESCLRYCVMEYGEGCMAYAYRKNNAVSLFFLVNKSFCMASFVVHIFAYKVLLFLCGILNWGLDVAGYSCLCLFTAIVLVDVSS